jgi:hypothetical protein
MTGEQIEFMGTYSERFQAGLGISTLYSEVTKAWIEKFGYDGVSEYGANVINIVDLRMGKHMETLTMEERTKATETHTTAWNAIRLVRTLFCHSLDHRSDGGLRESVVGFGTTMVTEKQTSWISRKCWRCY